MNSQDLSRWIRPGVSIETSPDGLPLIHLEGAFGKARFSPQGAHLIDFTPANGRPILFVSSRTLFAPGKAIRGGVPVIFPWFGPCKDHPELPMHGLVRARSWELTHIEVPAAGNAVVEFAFESNAETLSLWPHAFALKLRFELGQSVAISWDVTNTGKAPFTFEQALHPYFPVGSIHQASVSGLRGFAYVDKTRGGALSQEQSETIRFTEETDRLYLSTRTECVIEDPVRGSRLHITKRGSDSSVVWNPWIAKAAALADLDDSEWENFLCVEQVNALENAVELQPGTTHRMEACYAPSTFKA